MSTLKRHLLCKCQKGMDFAADMVRCDLGDWVTFKEAHALETEREALKAENEALKADLLNCLGVEAKDSRSGIVPVNKKLWAQIMEERDALKARVTELEAYLAGWVKISERNPPVPGIYKVMVTRPIHGGSFVSHIRWDGQLWESLNVGPIDYQLVAWYDNGLEI